MIRLILILMTFHIIPSMAQNTFLKILRGNMPDEARQIQYTSDGGFILTGTTKSYGTGYYDCFLTKLSNIGVIEWSKSYGGIDYDDAYSVKQTFDGGYIFGGKSRSFGGFFANCGYLVKTNELGDTLWTKVYGTSDQDFSTVIQTSDSGYLAAGKMIVPAAGYDILLIKTDQDGNAQWMRSIGEIDSNEFCNSIIPSNDGGFLLAGYTTSFGAGTDDIYVVKIDSLGNYLWSRTYGLAGKDKAWDIIATINGGFAITGGTYLNGIVESSFLMKIDSAGNILWNKIYENYGVSYSVIETDDNNFIMSGISGQDLFVIKVNIVGDTLWTRTYGNVNVFENGFSVAKCADGGFVAVGISNQYFNNDYDIMVAKTDSMGLGICNESTLSFIVSTQLFQTNIPPTVLNSINIPVNPTLSVVGVANFSDSTQCLTVGSQNIDEINKFSLFPNPSLGKFRLSIPNFEIHEIVIFNTFGQTIYNRKNIATSIADIDISNNPPGLYVMWTTDGQRSFSKKILVNNLEKIFRQ